ncbi:MAG: peptidoglycan-binding protein [Actinomycetia bacterium]|nr:peptidoglycan-binding protein [Actinomycetes bacterium]
MRSGLGVGIRWAALVVTGLVVVGLLVVFSPLAWLGADGTTDDVAAQRERSEITLAAVSRTVEAEGELVAIDQRTVGVAGATGVGSAPGTGTVTSLIDLGSPVAAGTVLFEIDDEPTVALVGEVPAWRSMGVDDVGVDVEQLETNLVALGYDSTGDLAVDDTFTSYTATIVERWQSDIGVEATGMVSFGSVVFVPDGVFVSSLVDGSGSIGGGGDAEQLRVSGLEREVVFTVAVELLDTIGPGTEVSAQMPDRSTATASVTELGPAGDGTWLATATLVGSPGEEVTLPDGEVIPVTVSWTELLAEETTTVRANAITKLDRGIHVIEVVNGDGSTSFFEVGIGVRSGSTVEIITELQSGTVIIAP